MDLLNNIVGQIGSFAWGPVMIVLLFSTGLLLTIVTRMVQYRKLGTAFKLLASKSEGEGEISPFAALMTSLSATIGTGNIAGVAGAIAAGGPGAVFWMWVTAVLGGATKFSEAVLAIKYRVTDEKGEQSGGPMYYASKGMEEKYGGNWKWLGWLFAFFAFLASVGIGNMVQSNSVAAAMEQSLGIPTWISGAVLAVAVALVIIGGIKSIAKVSEAVVPVMAIIYVIGSLIILFANAVNIPAAFSWIFSNAFTGKAVGGGLIGTVIRYGVARGIFSNEAGLGSAPIAHAASKTKDPVRQGLIASLGSFIDTIVICTMTALVVLTSGIVSMPNGVMQIKDGLNGAPLTTAAYGAQLPGFGGFIVSFGLVFFAFSTLLTWYFYGFKSLEYITNRKVADLFKWVWVVLTFFGATQSLKFVWNFSDAFNGLMAIPNLIALLALSPVIIIALKEYESKK
ncbi:MAG: sodium:alanine symporter family protein [Spirochaeta sp. LUC14_002_19_P3]|nr:MAG: sodium:alanine symporter family protein [Spirochaeta sp. LUC14_002_19_P3]